jgi:hypothetical protein
MTTFRFFSRIAATDAYLRAAEALVPGFASWGGADFSLSPACLLAGRDPIWIGRLVSAVSPETREERRAWAIDALDAQVGDLLAAAIGLDDSRVSLWCLAERSYLVRLDGSRAERAASGLLWDVARATSAEAYATSAEEAKEK